MKETPARIQALIEKYLRDECGEDELHELLQYLNTSEGMALLEQSMDTEIIALFRSRLAMEPAVSARIFNRLKEEILTGASETGNEVIPLRRKRYWWAATAAAAVVVLGIIGFFRLPGNNEVAYSTEAGQKRTVILEDGSRVTLNGNSSFSFRSSGERREVRLDGEAYFDVAHDAGKPFFVKTSAIEIKVLGTAFNVKSYGDDDAVETTLLRGKVQVKNLNLTSGGQEEMELLPNEQAVFRKVEASLIKISKPAEKEIHWQQGNLMFEDEPMRILLPELEKWYGVKIMTDERSQDCRFSMNIGHETLEDLLRFLEATTGVTTTRRGKEIRISGSLCE